MPGVLSVALSPSVRQAPMKMPGPYVPLDVAYLRDKDIRTAGPDAELLFLRGLAYAKGNYTDGHIPEYDLPVIAVGLKNVQARVDALVGTGNGLWLICDDGWQIRGWSHWNETSEQTAAKKRRDADRQAEKRARDVSVLRSVTSA